MATPIQILGTGTARALDGMPADADGRVRAVLSSLSADGATIRLIHSIEELAIVAAYEALSRGGVPVPYRGDGIGLVLGVEEGIDGIKARYFQGILADGPLGASPLTFPLTTSNSIAARISILLGLQGETVTLGGGGIAGGQAFGLAMRSLRDGHVAMALAGGATAVEAEFLHAASPATPSESGSLGGGACLLLLGRCVTAGAAGRGAVLGYGEGFGSDAAGDAIRACLEDAMIAPGAVSAVRVAALSDGASVVRALRSAGVRGAVTRSASSGLCAASFPLAVAEIVGHQAAAHAAVLVVGSDCLSGVVAAMVHGGP